ncbi:hypothetical protein F5148DRAFT_1377853 [Russula earlei]|uniref:Uncharacterized protein n=1 Tax=Russula earlei TaxID=71964 RepID=A0ACC0U2J7_9AGAM|nr:hypothetical protein F5148DRAFT_1377853 [Russula earlei]
MDLGIPSNSAPWSHLVPQEDQTSVWSETADNARPGPVNFDSLPGGSADIGWNTLLDVFRNGSGTFTAMDDTFPATSTPSPNSFERSGSFDYLDTEFHPHWQMPTLPFSEVDSVPSSASDDSWAELTTEPFQPPPVLDSVLVQSGFVTTTTTSHSQVDSTWPFGLGQFPCQLEHPYIYKSISGLIPLSYNAGSLVLAGVESSFQAGYRQARLYLPASGPPASDQDAFVVPQTLRGKRRQDEDHALEDANSEANNSQG